MRIKHMGVTHLQVTRISEGKGGATILHLQDGSISVVSPAWVAQHQPHVGGYLIDNGKEHGEQWFAKASVSTMAAVLVEVQRVEAKPGELILFKLPPQANAEDASVLHAHLKNVAPDLPCLITTGGNIEVVTISAQAVLANQGGAAPAEDRQ